MTAASKSAASRAANTARAKALQGRGTTAIGGRVKAKGFTGGKGAQERAGGLRKNARVSLRAKGSGVGAGTRSGMKASAASVAKARSRAASSRSTKMGKAPVSVAKARYKELSSRARKSSPERSAAENRQAAGARRSLNTMVAKRGRKR
jgi:hypothetical protein